MGYHGVLSKGCQRCRQRKVKCDLAKPACRRCGKTGSPCPGYRNLSNVQFIDESARVVLRATAQSDAQQNPAIYEDPSRAFSHPCFASGIHDTGASVYTPIQWLDIFPDSEAGLLHPSLGTAINVLSVNFFLAHYSPTGPVLSEESYDWLFQAYWDVESDLVRLATDAVSMAALSNKYFAPDMVPRSNHMYGRTISRLNAVLQDPSQATRDSTLMAVVLLGLYERVTLQNWDDYRKWSAHIEGATTLLKLRGKEQFRNAAGKQLYVHLRSQIIHNCMVQHTAVPESLKFTSSLFQPWINNTVTYDTRPGSLAHISFRIVNLRADVSARIVTDAREIMNTVLSLEKDLCQWTANAPQVCNPSDIPFNDILDTSDRNSQVESMDGVPAPVYADINAAQIWNNWRVLRIMTHQLLLRHTLPPLRPGTALKDLDRLSVSQENASMDIIRRMSADVLKTVTMIASTPRAGSLVWVLFIIAQEPLNPPQVRTEAIRSLRHVNDTLGYRIASLMADTAEETFENDDGDFPITHRSLRSLRLDF